ncbi:MAG: hypothetical protein ABJH28_00380 [Paraglaciecola sp.]|uniref:hypothetical protein n=1 Tax=Paraglaciecola sp. TaxID=1920173 RepID=UPI0032642BE4
MNRLDAYEIITERLKQLSSLDSKKLFVKVGAGLTELSKSSKGINYEMNFKLNGKMLQGSIHECGSQYFELMEESIALNS